MDFAGVLAYKIGLPLKVEKHLYSNPSKAAMYLAALIQRDGRPEEGSAERAALDELTAQGFQFLTKPCDDMECRHIACRCPDGTIIDGRDVLRRWADLYL